MATRVEALGCRRVGGATAGVRGGNISPWMQSGGVLVLWSAAAVARPSSLRGGMRDDIHQIRSDLAPVCHHEAMDKIILCCMRPAPPQSLPG